MRNHGVDGGWRWILDIRTGWVVSYGPQHAVAYRHWTFDPFASASWMDADTGWMRGRFGEPSRNIGSARLSLSPGGSKGKFIIVRDGVATLRWLRDDAAVLVAGEGEADAVLADLGKKSYWSDEAPPTRHPDLAWLAEVEGGSVVSFKTNGKAPEAAPRWQAAVLAWRYEVARLIVRLAVAPEGEVRDLVRQMRALREVVPVGETVTAAAFKWGTPLLRLNADPRHRVCFAGRFGEDATKMNPPRVNSGDKKRIEAGLDRLVAYRGAFL